MRLLVWILGVICTLEALMTSRAIAPAWSWVFWSWLAVWVLAGVVVLVVALVRMVGAANPRGSLHAPAPPPSFSHRQPGGE